MKAIVCIDDGGGMTFNRRRQSRDSVLLDDVAAMVEKSHTRLLAASFSEKLLTSHGISPLVIDDDMLKNANGTDFCFVENLALLPYIEKIDTLIIYRWNRKYPSDFNFDVNPDKNGFSLAETVEFVGSSHEKITKEIYTK